MLWLMNLGFAAGSALEEIVSVSRRGAGSGNKKRKKKQERWINIAGEYYRVSSALEEQQLVKAWYAKVKARLFEAEASTQTEKAKYARISLAKAVKRLESATLAAEIEAEEQRISRIREDDEIVIMLLANI